MMMKLVFNEDNILKTTNFLRIGDLWYFEGPLLSLFIEQSTNSFYLVDWVDNDSKYNRWIIYSVSPEYLQKFIEKKVSHFELFEARSEQDVFFVDIDSQKNPITNCSPKKLDQFPEIYYPSKKSYFDELDTRLYEVIKSTIKEHLKENKTDSNACNHLTLETSYISNFYTWDRYLTNHYYDIYLCNINTEYKEYNKITYDYTKSFFDCLNKELITNEYENQYN